MSPNVIKRPACICGIQILAILLMEAYLPRAVVWLPAAFSVLVGVILLACKQKWPGKCCILAGTLALLLSLPALGMEDKANRLYGSRTVAMRGQVQQVSSSDDAETVRAVIHVTEVEGEAASLRAYCPRMPQCETGEIISGKFVLGGLPHDGFRLQHYADRIFTQADYQSDFAVEGVYRSLSQWFAQLQLTWAGRIRYYLTEETGGVLAAMATGDRSGIPRALYNDYKKAGIPHVLVVSGLHLAVICDLVPLSMQRKKYRVGYGISTILLALFFMGLTGASPSVLRAGFTVLLHSTGILLGLPADPITSLALSGVIMSIGNPYAVCDIGFQLSFCATAGVLAASAMLKAMDLPDPSAAGLRKIRNMVAEQVLVSTMAALFILPVQLARHMPISRFSVFANLASFLLIRPMICCALAVAVLGGIPGLHFVVRGVSLVGGILARVLNGTVRFFAHLPGATVHPQPRVLLRLALTALLFWWMCRRRRYAPQLVAKALAGLAVAAILIHGGLDHNLIKITMLGESDAPAVVVTQNRQALVFFRGGKKAAKQIRACLDAQHIDEIDYLVDLRLNDPRPCPLEATRYKTLAQTEFEPVIREYPLDDVILIQTMELDGGMVALCCGRYVVWLYSGSLQLEKQADHMELLLASDGNPGSLAHCDTILSLSRSPDWLKKHRKDNVLYADGTALVRIRPRRWSRKWPVRIDT